MLSALFYANNQSVLNEYPCSVSHSMDLGRANFSLVTLRSESWNTMMEPLRVYFFTFLNTLFPFSLLL